MTATATFLLTVYAGLTAWMYARADRRFSHHPKLPMQWGFSGGPNWYAPRRLALIATPLLGGIGFIAVAAAVIAAPFSMTANRGLIVQLLVGLGVLGIVAFAGYLWLVKRWDRTVMSGG